MTEEYQPEYRLLTGAELDTLCQHILNTLPKYPNANVSNPYVIAVHSGTGFQTVSNLDNEQLRRFVLHLACEMDQEPTHLGDYTPPSRN